MCLYTEKEFTKQKDYYNWIFLIPGGPCPYKCEPDTSGVSGDLQSGVNSQLACQNRCNGNGLDEGLTCYAYDFIIVSNLCYIFTSYDYVTNGVGSTHGVNHCVKNCGGTSGNLTLTSYLYDNL